MRRGIIKDRKSISLLCILVAAIILPVAVNNMFLRHLLVLTLIYSVLGLSLDIILGHMGQFSFGHQAFFGMGAYTTAILTTKCGFPIWLSFIAGIFLAALFGLLVGFVALKRARGFFLGIITLGVGKITWMIAIKWRSLTGSTEGISFIPPPSISLPFIGTKDLDSALSYYYFALALLVLTLYLLSVWSRSRYGRAISAVRENEELAKSLGINPYSYYVAGFTLACALAGLSGVMLAHYVTLVAPDTVSMYYMTWLLAVVILGGRRTFAGPIVGAGFFVFLPQLLAPAKEFRFVIVGVIMLLSVLLLRNGIVPSITSGWNRLWARLKMNAANE